MLYSTIPDMFFTVCEKYKKKIAFRYKVDSVFQELDHDQLREKVECFALSLLDLGLRKGDRIGIISENRIEWIISNLAISLIGAVDVPVFPILTAKQEEKIYTDCEVSCLIVSNNFQLSKVMEFKENLASLRQIIVMNEKFDAQDPAVKSFPQLVAKGKSLKSDENRKTYFESYCQKIKPDDLCSLIYTSGTTGDPKGVMLSHKNFIGNFTGAIEVVVSVEDDISLLFLPMCHAYERVAGYYTVFSGGAIINLAESIDTVPSNIKEVAPTLITTVPKLLEMIRKKVYTSMEREPASKQKVFQWAMKVGAKYTEQSLGSGVSFATKTQYKLADKLVYSKIRERLGGRLTRIVTGGAALSPEVATFFFSLGIKVLQGYGLTEASPVVSLNGEDNLELGTIGKPIKDVEVKIAEDGEILVRGHNVMKGYWNDPVATNEAIDEDGWLYTGDVGKFTAKGNLKITDRKKNIFVSSGGKNIAPQAVENLLAQSKYIDHCMLIGDNREFCSALITPDFNQVKELADEFELPYNDESELISNPKVLKRIKKDIDWLQRDLSKFERVRKFSILSKSFSVEDGELSPKMSVKRHVVEKKYSDLIDSMYGT